MIERTELLALLASLQRRAKKHGMISATGRGTVVSLTVFAIFLAANLAALAFGSSLPVPLRWLTVVAIVLVFVGLLFRAALHRAEVDWLARQADAAADTKNRLASAVEFSRHNAPTPLMQAAIADADRVASGIDAASAFRYEISRRARLQSALMLMLIILLLVVSGFAPVRVAIMASAKPLRGSAGASPSQRRKKAQQIKRIAEQIKQQWNQGRLSSAVALKEASKLESELGLLDAHAGAAKTGGKNSQEGRKSDSHHGQEGDDGDPAQSNEPEESQQQPRSSAQQDQAVQEAAMAVADLRQSIESRQSRLEQSTQSRQQAGSQQSQRQQAQSQAQQTQQAQQGTGNQPQQGSQQQQQAGGSQQGGQQPQSGNNATQRGSQSSNSQQTASTGGQPQSGGQQSGQERSGSAQGKAGNQQGQSGGQQGEQQGQQEGGEQAGEGRAGQRGQEGRSPGQQGGQQPGKGSPSNQVGLSQNAPGEREGKGTGGESEQKKPGGGTNNLIYVVPLHSSLRGQMGRGPANSRTLRTEPSPANALRPVTGRSSLDTWSQPDRFISGRVPEEFKPNVRKFFQPRGKK